MHLYNFWNQGKDNLVVQLSKVTPESVNNFVCSKPRGCILRQVKDSLENESKQTACFLSESDALNVAFCTLKS